MKGHVFIAGAHDSIFNQILFEIRDEKLQQDRARFRLNLEKAGEYLAYEISKHLPYESREVTTPLGTLDMSLPSEFPVIISILRAGVPMHNGMLRILNRADNGFVSAYRHHTSSNKFIIKVEYNATPSVEGRDIILVDPMIATGNSVVLSYETIITECGLPRNVFIAGLIGSEQGIELVQRKIPEAKIFIGAIDKELTGKAYIVPGLGDAGDLAFGSKHRG